MWILLACWLLLTASIYGVLKIPKVQRYLLQELSSTMSRELKTEVRIGEIDVNFFMDVVLSDMLIRDLSRDTLLYAGRVQLDVDDIWFRAKQLQLGGIELKDSYINMTCPKGGKFMNYQFIVDYFSSGKPSDTTIKTKPWILLCDNISLDNVRFRYFDDPLTDGSPGMDYWGLDIKNISGEFSNLECDGDSIVGDISGLTAKDRCGFTLNKLSCHATVSSTITRAKGLRIETPYSNIDADVTFNYAHWGSYVDFITEVDMNADFRKSIVSFYDISFYAPQLWGVTDVVTLTGHVDGKVNDLKSKDVKISFGEKSTLSGDFRMTGLPEVNSTFMFFNIKELNTNNKDLSNVPIPPFDKRERLRLPESLNTLGDISYKGHLTGFFHDMVSDGVINTSIGTVKTDVRMMFSDSVDFAYSGSIASFDFDLGRFLGKEDIMGKINLNLYVDGYGVDQDAVVDIKGGIGSFELNDYKYQNITLDGQLGKRLFNGALSIAEPSLNLDFKGKVDFRGTIPVMNFDASLENVDLAKLNFIKSDTVKQALLTTNIVFNFTGDNIDNLNGVMRMTNTTYGVNNQCFRLNNLSVLMNEESGNRSIRLKSDVLDANITGQFTFMDFPGAINRFMRQYIPSFPSDSLKLTAGEKIQDFEFMVKVYDFSNINSLFIPKLSISKGAEIVGSYNSEFNNIHLEGEAKSVAFGNAIFDKVRLRVNTKGNSLLTEFKSRTLKPSPGTIAENVVINADLRKDTLLYGFNWDNHADKDRYSGDVSGKALLSWFPKVLFSLDDSRVEIADTVWTISGDNLLAIDSSAITIIELSAKTEEGKLGFMLDGKISEDPRDTLNVTFDKFNIANFNILTKPIGLTVGGVLDGKIELSNVYNNLFLQTNLIADNLVVNEDHLGRADIQSVWDDKSNAMFVDAAIMRGNIRSLVVHGGYYPDRKKDNFDFSVKLDRFKPQMFEHYMEGLFSEISRKSTIMGDVTLKGSPDEPLLNGELQLLGVGFKIDYLNTNYTFSDKVKIKKDGFYFDNLVLYGSTGEALVNGSIKHHNFKDFRFDISADAKKLEVLNTTIKENELFYGHGVASGKVSITGTTSNVLMTISAKTEKGTHFYLPLNSAVDVADNNFVTFINNTNKDTANKADETIDLSGVQLDFDLEATPDAEMQIIMDEKIGDVIKATGSGNMKFLINTLGDFNMYGDYVIEQGDYLFTLQNVINKRFDIQKGGTLKWNGDPYDGSIDLNATYSLRTSLKPLRPSGMIGLSIDTSNRRVPVNCIIAMKNSLFNPEINFEIKFPSFTNQDEESKRYYENAVNTDLTQQVFSLLVMNGFVPPSNLRGGESVQTIGNNALGANSSELLSNQLSNWMSQISKDFDLGVNYRRGDNINRDELEVAFSTQTFNDRLSIDGVFGKGGTQQNASSIVGDVNIEWKITEEGRLRLKAFNKTNTSTELIRRNAPYTQGIGLFYRTEFNSFKDLLRRQKREKK